jgi:hypothetical protein
MNSVLLRVGVTCIAITTFLSVGLVQAQAPAPPAGASDDITALKAQVDTLTKKVDAQEQANTQQKTENAQMRSELDALKTKQDMENEPEPDLSAVEGQQFTPSLSVYGFMDIGLLFSQLEKTNAVFGPIASKPSFFQNQINIYFSGKIAEELSALVELRFSYLPNGSDKSYGFPVLGEDYKYERVDTTVFSPTSGQELTFNGVMIDRAVVTWSLYDFLGFRFGRFITPFGIWNVDHSPTVVLPIRLPYIITMGPIPLRQTGVEAFGRVFPFANSNFEYGVSLSNGRGPTEEIYDLDNNKALGLRLKGTYDVGDYSAALGGYLYWGQVTDLNKDLIVDSSGVRLKKTTTERYKELAGSADLTIKIMALTLQSEYARTLVEYSKRPMITYLGTEIPNVWRLYWPDYVNWNVYGLLAYEIGINLWNKDMSVTPYIMYEYNSYDGNVWPQLCFRDIRGGLVLRPIAAAVVKYEISYYTVDTKEDMNVATQAKSSDHSWEHQIQLAVSF